MRSGCLAFCLLRPRGGLGRAGQSVSGQVASEGGKAVPLLPGAGRLDLQSADAERVERPQAAAAEPGGLRILPLQPRAGHRVRRKWRAK